MHGIRKPELQHVGIGWEYNCNFRKPKSLEGNTKPPHLSSLFASLPRINLLELSNVKFYFFKFKVGVALSSCIPGCLINPCENGGSHKPLFPTDYTTPRFKCSCPLRYAGNLCQHRVKSCRGFNNGSRIPGIYKIFDDSMNLFEVFCDFDSNSTNAWTLVSTKVVSTKKQGFF